MRTERLPLNLDGYVTEGELAGLLGITVSTLKRWRRLRRGPPFTKFGDRLAYRREAFEEWLLSCERVMPREKRKAA
jgi:Helix-turn-helix domain